MTAKRSMSRRKKTTLTVVGVSAVAATVAWVFWADFQRVFRLPALRVGKPTVKFTGKVTKAQADEYNRLANDPKRIADAREQYRQQLLADGYTPTEVAAALVQYDSVT